MIDSAQYHTARRFRKIRNLSENKTNKNNILTHWSVAQAGSNDVKNLRSKNSLDCPFKKMICHAALVNPPPPPPSAPPFQLKIYNQWEFCYLCNTAPVLFITGTGTVYGQICIVVYHKNMNNSYLIQTLIENYSEGFQLLGVLLQIKKKCSW